MLMLHASVNNMREMSEELGLAASGDGAVLLRPDDRQAIVDDKSQWLPLAQAGSFPVERTRIRTLSHRITPPFGPVQFDNAFLHLHLGDGATVPDIDLHAVSKQDRSTPTPAWRLTKRYRTSSRWKLKGP